jgi:signal transduction histidine kinase
LVRITIADNGPGLNEEQQTRLFEPFYTTRSTGTGLGMSICERVIRTHGGSIRFEPRPQGACFVIELPLEPSGGPLRHTETLGDVSPVASESSEHEFA